MEKTVKNPKNGLLYGLWMSFRPKTLTAAIVPIFVGTAILQVTEYSPQWGVVVFALLSALCIQIGTNLVNDVADFKKGADTEERLGPQRVTQSGVMSSKQVTGLAVLFFILAVIFSIPLVLAGGLPIVLIGIASIFCGYAYTAGPFPLAYKGFGDLFVVLFFGLVAVGGMFYLQTKSFSFSEFWPAVIGGLQVGFLSTVLIAINNLRDMKTDKKVGKKTLAVRFGQTFSRFEITLLLLLPFVFNYYWYSKGFVVASLLPLVLLPSSIKLARDIFRTEPSAIYNKYLGQSAKIHGLFGMLLAVGFYL